MVQVHRAAKENIVIEVEVTLRQIRYAVDVGLDVARIKRRQRMGGNQVLVVDDGEPLRRAQPRRGLPIGHHIHMPMVREEALQRTQVAAQFVVVPKPAFHIGVNRHGTTVVQTQFVTCLLALQAPGGVLAVHPQINDVYSAVFFLSHSTKAHAIWSRAVARWATVRSMLCSFSSPNKPTRKLMKSAGSSHCSGTPAAVCRPWPRNFLLDWMPGSSV